MYGVCGAKRCFQGNGTRFPAQPIFWRKPIFRGFPLLFAAWPISEHGRNPGKQHVLFGLKKLSEEIRAKKKGGL
ncbi:hypothetical protein [Silvibacterium sp.]|uniref:hypothetical protein n=1 Tax=Silvibacterium sp. TaxID=1964179 RepID=UPI0039E3058F